MAKDDTLVRIPVGLDEGKVVDATLYLPAPMTSGQWSQMLSVLEAMKPVLVEQLASTTLGNREFHCDVCGDDTHDALGHSSRILGRPADV